MQVSKPKPQTSLVWGEEGGLLPPQTQPPPPLPPLETSVGGSLCARHMCSRESVGCALDLAARDSDPLLHLCPPWQDTELELRRWV